MNQTQPPEKSADHRERRLRNMGTNPPVQLKKNNDSTTQHDAPSGVQGVRRRVVTVSLTCATFHCTVHVLVTNMSFVRDLENIFSNSLRDVLVLLSTLEIVLAHILRAVLVLQDWRRSIDEPKWTFLLLCLLCDLLSFLIHCCFRIWSLHCFG